MNLAVSGLLIGILSVDAGLGSPPAELACLARHYRVTPVHDRGSWFAELPDGSRIPFNDGRSKAFEERLASPDVKDIFLPPYRAGIIRPVEVANEDPGRIRVEAILAATYGGPNAADHQVRVRFLGMPVRIHRDIAPTIERVSRRLERARKEDPGLAPFLRRLSGGFAARKIAGTDRTSAHAFGIAIDLDKSQSDYWRWQKQGEPLRWRNRIPQAIVDAFESEGFIWGGRWYHFDTMHFEYRPELFGPPCRERASATSGSRPR